MVVDGEYHGGLSADEAVKLLKKVAAAGDVPQGEAVVAPPKASARGRKKS
jgi:hypothetical protein